MPELPVSAWVWVGVASLPLVLTLLTALTKALVVVSALRTGLGAEGWLPWSAVLGVGAVVSAVVMAPVGVETWTRVQQAGGLDALVAAPAATWGGVAQPLLDFASQQASRSEVEFFADLGGRAPTDPLVIVPAFFITELGEALAIAVMVLVPFVLVDLVVAQGLALVGVPVAGPRVALPLKVILFLAAGGWDVIVGGLARGYT